MTVLNHVFDGSLENFQQLVVENSKKGAVLVNYWAPNAGPCLKLWQVLEKLSEEYQGRFLLVNVNTDRQTALVRQQGITSVPTVKIYHRGEVVESIYGAQSETSIRRCIDKYVSQTNAGTISQAVRMYQSGEVEKALELLIRTASAEPNNLKLHSMIVKLLLREERYADIESYVAALVEEVREQEEISTLRVHAKMLHLAQLAPATEQLDKQLEKAPDDLDTVMTRAAVALVQDDYETALLHLASVLRKDRHYCDELPRKAMLVIFALLGDDHELSKTFAAAMREELQ
jgi:putative thioredoxin